MQIINSVYILWIVRSAIYQWKWRNDIEIQISNGLKEMNDYINNIGEESVSKRQRRYSVTERTTHTLTDHPNINLLIQWNEWVNLLIQLNEPNLTYSNITHTFEKRRKESNWSECWCVMVAVSEHQGIGTRANGTIQLHFIQ